MEYMDRVQQLMAITECRRMVQEEYLRACQQWGNEEYKAGVLAAFEMLLGLERTRAELVMMAWSDPASASRVVVA